MIKRRPAEKTRHIAHGAFARILRYKERSRAEEQAAAEKRVRAQELADERARSAQPWERDRWLADCREARRKLEGSLAVTTDDPLLCRIEQEFTNCGTEIGVLVCRKCNALELGSGDSAVRAGSKLCGWPGCPYCDAEDRALRGNTLDRALDDLRIRATSGVRKLRSYVAKMEKHRNARTRKGHRILTARKAAIGRLLWSNWWAFEVQCPYQSSDLDGKILERFRDVLNDLPRLIARLRRDHLSGDGTEWDLSAFGAWIEQPTADTIVLRGVFFGPSLSIDELTDLLASETQQSKVGWLREIEPDQTAAWVSILSCGADHSADAAKFAEGWHCNQPRHVIPARLSLLWSAAAALAGVEAIAWSYGALRDYYRAIHDTSRSRRVEMGRCATCHADVTFREQIVGTERYLGRCLWLKHPPLAPRELPSEPEGYFPDSESEANARAKRKASSDED